MAEPMILTTKLQEERDYWLARLSGEVGGSNLALDFPRPKIYAPRGEGVSLELPDELTRKLTAMTGGSPFLLYTCLMAALKVCLYKHTGSSTVVVGSPAHRDASSESRQPNALAIVDELDDRQSFRDLLAAVRATLTEAYKRQSYPFEYLVQDLRLGGVENKSPLFDVVLAFEGLHAPTPELRNDIRITFARGDEKIRAVIEYDASLFRRASVERFAEHLRITLEEAVAKLGEPIHSLDIWTDEERQELQRWNETRRDYQRDACLHQLFEAQAARTPEAPALIFHDQQLTYAELNARANRLAHRLRSLGVGPDSLVGMFCERSLELMVGLVAILKAGGACVPFDIAYPKERLAFMLEDSRVPVLLTQRRMLDSLPAHAAETILLDELDDAHGPDADANPSSGVTAGNLLFVLYTSGSTGRPKGVAMPHRSLTNLITWHLRELDTPGARTLQYTAISFDVSFQEIFTTLCGGGALVLIEDDVRKDAAALLRHMAAYGVERIFMPFIALQHMAEAAEAGASVPSKLKDIVAGGEQLQVTPAVVALIRRLDGVRLHNHYGPTETHVVTNYTMEGRPGDWPTLPPVGRAVANAQIYILDSRGRAVPAGVPGELYIGGDALSRAYINRPDLTAERYVPHPLASVPGERLYKTGDLARYLPDGNIEFMGRADFQVKIRGVRIELGEIETVLQQHEAVRDGVVVAREDGRGSRRLVAYVVPSGRQECTGPSLRRFLSEKLTEHMIPSAFVMLDVLPLTPSGKVNRRALPAPDFSRVELAHAFVAPRTAAEEVVAEIWKQLLGVERVGATDNFFELGGHSLLGTQLISKLARTFRTELPLRQLFRSPTVEGLVGELAQVWGGREVVEEIAATYLEVERLTAAEIAETLETQNEGASA